MHMLYNCIYIYLVLHVMDLACNIPYLSLHYWNGDYEQKTLSYNQSQNIQFFIKLFVLLC